MHAHKSVRKSTQERGKWCVRKRTCGKVQERDGMRKKASHEGMGKSKCMVAGKATR